MPNPLAIAFKGKGVMPMLARAGAISRRYGLTSGKMADALAQLTGILREYNCQATLPITASALARNGALVKKIHTQGMELALHGYTHTDYTQLSIDQLHDHLRRARQVIDNTGVQFKGFRCPYLRCNMDTLKALGEFRFDYDSSQAIVWDVVGAAETDDYRRVLSFYNAQKAADYPALPRLAGELVRIPYCLPDDEALVERLKLVTSSGITEIWLAMLEQIYAKGELFTLGIHPERVPLCADALRAVLAKARLLTPTIWITRLEEIASWYRTLGKATFETQPLSNSTIRICIHAPARATILARSVKVDAPKKAWTQGYEQVMCNDLTIEEELRPWIGLPPDRPVSLQSFLQHQGYLVEISTNPSNFSYFFQSSTFHPEDERPLLAELETGNQPLLRLNRWPEGAKAALVITGDVDAFTLWDYGLRICNR